MSDPILPLPWAPKHLLTRAAGRIALIMGLGHTRDDCWIECEIAYPNQMPQRLRLHPAQILADSPHHAAQQEMTRLTRAVSAYRLSHGYWDGERWRSHDRPCRVSQQRHRKARGRKYRERLRPTRRPHGDRAPL
jgi:hypothetical protein